MVSEMAVGTAIADSVPVVAASVPVVVLVAHSEPTPIVVLVLIEGVLPVGHGLQLADLVLPESQDSVLVLDSVLADWVLVAGQVLAELCPFWAGSWRRSMNWLLTGSMDRRLHSPHLAQKLSVPSL